MQFQFNSDSRTTGDTRMADHVEAIVTHRLERLIDRLTRIEVHAGDINGPRAGGDDKQVTVEIRVAGMAPISGTDRANDFDTAVLGAADKVLAAYDRLIGKRTTRKGH